MAGEAAMIRTQGESHFSPTPGFQLGPPQGTGRGGRGSERQRKKIPNYILSSPSTPMTKDRGQGRAGA